MQTRGMNVGSLMKQFAKAVFMKGVSLIARLEHGMHGTVEWNMKQLVYAVTC